MLFLPLPYQPSHSSHATRTAIYAKANIQVSSNSPCWSHRKRAWQKYEIDVVMMCARVHLRFNYLTSDSCFVCWIILGNCIFFIYSNTIYYMLYILFIIQFIASSLFLFFCFLHVFLFSVTSYSERKKNQNVSSLNTSYCYSWQRWLLCLSFARPLSPSLTSSYIKVLSISEW